MMLAGPNHTGVYTVSINPSMTSHGVSQSAPLTVPALNIQAPTQPMLSPRPNAQPLVTTPGQLVNVTAVRSSPIVKSHACSYCQKSFSSRYNVNRHEKICKLNTNAPVAEVVVQQQLPQHNKESPAKMYMCHLCQKTFTSADSLNRHQKKCKDQRGIVGLPHSSSMGSGQQRRLHICKYCAKDFSTKWNVIRHERLFHKPGDPIVVPETILNGTIADVPIPAPVIGKPERYCRFCGNYFSSKYNAHRHEKICTRIKDGVEIQTSTHNPEDLQKPMQVMFSTAQSPPISLTLSSQTHQLQQHTPQRQQITQQQAQQQQQQQQITQQQQQQNLATQQQQQQQQQVQHQHTIQTVQGHQLLPQQTMLLIDPHHLQPFHVCKFCNKQMSTRCDAVDSQTLSNVQTVATVTGQHMQLPAGSSAQLTSLMAPVMASLPQVALVQPHGQLPMIQQQSHLQQQQQQQQVKPQQSQQTNQLQTSTRGQQGSQQQQQQQQQQLALQQQLSLQQHQTQMSQGQQQITQLQPMQQVQTQNQQVQQPQQQIQQDQNQQQNFPHHQQQQQQANVERPHACRYCDKHFATKWYLDQHERIHTGEADMCKQCGKYFVTRWHLEKHMRVHLPGQARKMKKDSQTSSSSAVAVVSEQTSLPTEIKDLPFSQQMIIGSNTVVVSGDGQHIASSVSVSSTSESIRALSERPQSATYVLSADHTQYFLPGLGSGTPQVAVVPSSASQEQDHNDQSQQASTIDKSQISITY